MAESTKDLVTISAEIAAAYLTHNRLPQAELNSLIREIHAALSRIGAPVESIAAPVEALVPAVSIRKSVTPDAIICLEDGLPFKSLKRHLMTSFGMTPAQYRAKWGLPHDYPMVASVYSARRSQLAKASSLGINNRGRHRRKS